MCLHFEMTEVENLYFIMHFHLSIFLLFNPSRIFEEFFIYLLLKSCQVSNTLTHKGHGREEWNGFQVVKSLTMMYKQYNNRCLVKEMQMVT